MGLGSYISQTFFVCVCFKTLAEQAKNLAGTFVSFKLSVNTNSRESLYLCLRS